MNESNRIDAGQLNSKEWLRKEKNSKSNFPHVLLVVVVVVVVDVSWSVGNLSFLRQKQYRWNHEPRRLLFLIDSLFEEVLLFFYFFIFLRNVRVSSNIFLKIFFFYANMVLCIFFNKNKKNKLNCNFFLLKTGCRVNIEWF